MADQQGTDRYAIHAACREGQVNVVESLLGSDPKLAKRKDEDGRLPLHWAVCSNHYDIVELFVEQQSTNIDIDTQDDAGWTALMMASGIKDGDRIVDLILSKGADVNATTNNGQTALHLASSKDNVDVVTKLVDRGANVAVKDKRNQKALHRAAAGGCEPIVRILLKGQGKASVDAMDSDGLSALHHAIAEGHGETAMILLRVGARLRKREDQQDPLLAMQPSIKVVDYINRKAEEEGIAIAE